MPWKLLQIKELALSHDRRILPIHLQLIPTNNCNGNCPWCSCAGVNRRAELSFDEICSILKFFVSNGTRAVTITGGGEPTLHPHFYSIVKTANDLGLSIGIVSNGLKFRRGTIEHADYLSGACDWVRISTMNTNTDGDQMEVFENIAKQITCSLGISFTVASDVNCDLGKRVCDTVEKYPHVTHVRFVEDIVNPDDSAMQRLEEACKGMSPKAIFQYRSKIYPGTKRCYMSRLKPLVDATGLLFPCCVEENETVLLERDGLLRNTPIQEVKKGDICLSDSGSGEVVGIYKKTTDKLLRITTTTGRSVLVSEDHIMLRANFDPVKKGSTFEEYEVDSYTVDEISAKNMTVGDFIPTNMYVENRTLVDDITETEAFILGAYVAEGWTSNGLGLMFGKHAIELTREFISSLTRLGITYAMYERDTGNQISLHLKTIPPVLRSLLESCGERALTKTVPCQIQNSSLMVKKAFLRGYLMGDGCISGPRDDYRGYKLSMSTVSRRLASDLILLLQQVGIAPTVYFENRRGATHIIEGREVGVNDRYTIKVSGKYNLDKIPEIVGDLPEQTRSQRRAISYPHKGMVMFVPVRSIELVHGEFTMYDLQVAGTNKFLAGMGGLLVHNCGVQYAGTEDELLKMPPRFAMGYWSDYNKFDLFDGSICARCDYTHYNEIMHGLTQPMKHIYHV